MPPLRVLVTNARRRKAVPIVRALGKAGMQVVCADTVRHACAFTSRYCTARVVHPDPEADGFIDAIVAELSARPCDAIFPLDDDVLEVLSRNRARLPKADALLLSDHETLMLADDKSLLTPYAAALGIPVPHTIVMRSERDIARLSDLEMPVVVKPARGSGSRGLQRTGDRQQLRHLCQAALADGRRVLVQEQLAPHGAGLGYFALYDRDRRLVAQFMHRRLREYPLSGGPSTFREGIWDEDLARQGRRLLESLNWVGLAMVEFKTDTRDGQPKLMEINPRFWGSIALPVFSGVNFPVLAANVTAGRPAEPAPRPELGRKARWLCPGDLLHLAASLRRGRWPRGFLRLFDRRTCYDLLSWRDPLPAPGLIVSTLVSLCGRHRRGVRGGRDGQHVTASASRRPDPPPHKAAPPAPAATMTVDVEDWFHILDSPAAPDIQQWDALESRVERNVDRLLEVFDGSGTRATFFWLGWMAQRHKNLLRRCQQAGHEIASHGYAHVLAYQVGPERFGQDVVRAKGIIEDITGQPAAGFRAAGFGITDETEWALDVIRRAGHRYDSSLFPAPRGHGGLPEGAPRPHMVQTGAGSLVECPASVVRLLGRRVSLFGGGYLRLAPRRLIRWGIDRLRTNCRPLIVYIHPREVDPHHRRLPLGLKRRFKCYVNLRTTLGKLQWLCREVRFGPMCELVDHVVAHERPPSAELSAAA